MFRLSAAPTAPELLSLTITLGTDMYARLLSNRALHRPSTYAPHHRVSLL
ncbi:hypothetical protein RSAG8_05058, partial [Rhizoctonia solani AG-8 WAC10335]